MGFDPATIGMVLTGVSGIVSGIGSFSNAKQQTNMGNYNAQVFEQQAQAERESQRLLEFQKRKVIKSQIGSQVSAAGASGFRFSGDPLTIMQESHANAELDLAIDKYNSEVRARGYQSQAGMARYEAAQDAKRSKAQGVSSFLETAIGIGTKILPLGK